MTTPPRQPFPFTLPVPMQTQPPPPPADAPSEDARDHEHYNPLGLDDDESHEVPITPETKAQMFRMMMPGAFRMPNGAPAQVVRVTLTGEELAAQFASAADAHEDMAVALNKWVEDRHAAAKKAAPVVGEFDSSTTQMLNQIVGLAAAQFASNVPAEAPMRVCALRERARFFRDIAAKFDKTQKFDLVVADLERYTAAQPSTVSYPTAYPAIGL